FLLLAHCRGCEEIDGMCCFNLSDNSVSIHKKIQWLEEHNRKTVKDVNPFDEW
ncbi:hypothetical protein N307_15365, partial [Dryobates pubescens]